MTCCILANRPQKLPWRFQEEDPRCIRLKELLRLQLSLLVREHGVRRFLSGMERGVDTYAAELILELRETYPVSLECVLASEEQAVAWLERERDRFFALVERADRETLLQGRRTEDSYRIRNSYMIGKSDIVLAVWDGAESGTGRSVRYAREMGKRVLEVNTLTLAATPLLKVVK